LTYTISKVSCDTSSQIKTGVIAPTKTATISPFILDGKYHIFLDDGDTTEEFDILYYENLLASFIVLVESILCGCTPCKDCEECNECEDYLQAIVKSFAFAALNYPLYQPYINNLIINTQCDLDALVTCSLLKEKVYGHGEIKEVLVKIIRDYYASFYYKDLSLAESEEEKEYVKTKYKATKILKCIRKLGTNPSEVLETAEANAKVYYWQLDNTVDDLDEVTNAVTGIPYLEAKPNSPFAEFEIGKTVTYTNVGRIVFVIAPTLVEDFIIKDSLNNNITDEFDIAYNSDFSAAFFVSKAYYGLSDIYFKFKKDF